jgi:hypothetical protein
MEEAKELLTQHEKAAIRLNQELVRIQTALKAPKTLGGGERIRFQYRNCEQIIELLKPLLNGLSIVMTDDMVAVGGRIYVKSEARLSDGVVGISSFAWAREPENPTVMSQPQMSGAISSYARKYALCGLFAIDGGAEDPDSIDMEGRREEPVRPAKESCTDTQKMDLQLLGVKYEDICRHFKTSDLTKAQAALAIASIQRKRREQESK